MKLTTDYEEVGIASTLLTLIPIDNPTVLETVTVDDPDTVVALLI